MRHAARETIAILGLLMALRGISYGGTTNLLITLRPVDTTVYSAKPWRPKGDSRLIQMRLDWLYDEPGFRPPSERAKVECRDNRILVTVSDTNGAARVEYLASTQGRVSFRRVAADTVAADIVDSADNWVRRHPVAGLDSLGGVMWYHRSDLLVSDRDYTMAVKTLAGVDTLVFGNWRPMFGSPDTRRSDTTRTLYLVARQAEMSNARGRLIEHAYARRFRGARAPNAPPMPEETFPFVVEFRLTHDTLSGCDPVRKLADVTAALVGQRLAMTMDSFVVSAPVIQDTVRDGSFMVPTNDMLGTHALDMRTVLLTGSLSTPLTVERVERVGGE